MLAMADRHGMVSASVPGLAHIARVTEKECRDALRCLAAPDPDSRTKTLQGRRISEVDGGWEIINYPIYRDRASEEQRREQERLRKQRYRARASSVHPPSRLSLNVPPSEAEAEAEAEAPADGDLQGLGKGADVPQKVSSSRTEKPDEGEPDRKTAAANLVSNLAKSKAVRK